MAFDYMTILYIVVVTLFLWLMLYLSTRWIISKSFAADKKIALLLASFLIVLLVPIVTGAVMYVLNFAGQGMAELRNLIDPNDGGQNIIGSLGAVIAFLIFVLLLHLIVKTDWTSTIWISLIGIFLLYLVYCAVPELNFRLI